MKRGNNNVFKVSGSLALGGGSEYTGGDNMARQGSYGTSSNSNTMKRPSGYGQQQPQYDAGYDYNQKSGTSQTRKYSRNNIPQSGSSGLTTGVSYGGSSTKKMEYNYPNTLNKMQSVESYNNKGYGNKNSTYSQQNSTNSYGQQQQGSYSNSGSYKDVYGNSNSNQRSTNSYQNNRGYGNQREETSKYNQRQESNNRNYCNQRQQTNNRNNYNQRQESNTYNQREDNNRNYNQQQDYPKTKSKITQQEPQPYTNPNSRIPPKNALTKPNKNTYQQPPPPTNNYNQEFSNNNKQQIKEYDPSTFSLCRQGCGRKFNPDSIAKHQKICKKVFQNKRPEFNVQQQRIIAKDQKKLMKQGEIVEKKIEQKKNMEIKKQNMPKWKAQSIGFRAALKVNRKGAQMTPQEKRIVSEAQNAGMIKCKFCGRTFSEKAAQRHVPFCETQQKKNALIKKKK